VIVSVTDIFSFYFGIKGNKYVIMRQKPEKVSNILKRSNLLRQFLWIVFRIGDWGQLSRSLQEMINHAIKETRT